jgi:Alcohol dehydrogenase GroES-like domain
VTATPTATVRVAVMRAPGTLELDDFPFPELEDCAVLTRVSYSGVCGTDKHTFRGETKQYPGTPPERAIEYPLICGHGNVGVVEAVGGRGALASDGRRLAPGDWIVPGAWAEVGDFALRTDPALMICLELHPGTVAYNVETFERLAALSPAMTANIDPSHFFWMRIFRAEKLALNGLLDHRWPAPATEMPWNFAVVGRGHGLPWWQALLTDLAAAGRVKTIAIEHEDPFVAPEIGIQQAARLLAEALGSAASTRMNA